MILGINGKFYNYVSTSKQRRKPTTKQITAQIDDNDRNEIIKKKNRKINQLEDKLAFFESIANEHDEYTKKLANLFKLGIIGDEGFVIKNSQKKRWEHWRSKIWYFRHVKWLSGDTKFTTNLSKI